VSRLNQKICRHIEAWRNRKIEGEFPYLCRPRLKPSDPLPPCLSSINPRMAYQVAGFDLFTSAFSAPSGVGLYNPFGRPFF